MGDVQKKVLKAIRERAEKVGLEFLNNSKQSNEGVLFLQDGFKTVLSVTYEFQTTDIRLRFFPEGVKPVFACGFHPKGCSFTLHSDIVDLHEKMPEIFEKIDQVAVKNVQDD